VLLIANLTDIGPGRMFPRMKFLLTACLLLISIPTLAVAQQQGGQTSLTRTETREAERRLSELGYWTGAVDGVFDPATRSALIAFQKWEGRPITGELTLAELGAIRAGAAPKARDSGYAHIEVDLDRQVLLVVNDDDSVRVLPVATGNEKQFVDEGEQSIAHTPRGRFVVYEKEFGWHTGSLGAVYYANFISGGVAIHGSRNVPIQPASHGCIRVPLFAAREVSKLLPVGMIVLVYDQVSFVSAKEWVKNPKLKQAGMLISAADDDVLNTAATKSKPKTVAIRKARPRMIRAD
jgi:peptidoglycan hydrolase-like protein with peptidoglycan-binding domain